MYSSPTKRSGHVLSNAFLGMPGQLSICPGYSLIYPGHSLILVAKPTAKIRANIPGIEVTALLCTCGKAIAVISSRSEPSTVPDISCVGPHTHTHTHTYMCGSMHTHTHTHHFPGRQGAPVTGLPCPTQPNPTHPRWKTVAQFITLPPLHIYQGVKFGTLGGRRLKEMCHPPPGPCQPLLCTGHSSTLGVHAFYHCGFCQCILPCPDLSGCMDEISCHGLPYSRNSLLTIAGA